MLGIFLYQRNDLELYICVAKCLSEMTDDEVTRGAQITEVITYLYFFTIAVGITVEDVIRASFWLKLVLLRICYWLISGNYLCFTMGSRVQPSSMVGYVVVWMDRWVNNFLT